jgi:hypothetical protein
LRPKIMLCPTDRCLGSVKRLCAGAINTQRTQG